MSKENCFSHLKKRFDEKSEEWQKTWDFLPDTVFLADKVLEELKLVGAMEEVRTDSTCFSYWIVKIKFTVENEIELNSLSWILNILLKWWQGEFFMSALTPESTYVTKKIHFWGSCAKLIVNNWQ